MTYVPEHFRERRIDVLHDAIRSRSFADLVTFRGARPVVDHVPMLLSVDAANPHGYLRGHVARGNPVVGALADADSEVLAVFHLGDAYVSPTWYATKHEHGRVVPTWNYAVIHAYGIPRLVDDPGSILANVRALTERHESAMQAPWSVDDAPAPFIEALARSIVAFEIRITEIVGKCKASQNQPPENRAGVAEALSARGERALAAMVATGTMEPRSRG